MPRPNIIMMVLLLLVIAFGSLSLIEYSNAGTQKTETVTSTTTVMPTASANTTTLDPSSSYSLSSGRCCVAIDTSENDNGTTFAYLVWNASMPASFTFDNVTFSSVAENGTNTNCLLIPNHEAGYVSVTFPDGASSQLNTCSLAMATPGITILVTSHIDPQAGLLWDSNSNTIELLVAYSSPPLG